MYGVSDLLYLLNNLGKYGWIVFCESRKDLTIKHDVVFVDAIHEFAVAEIMKFCCRADLDLPETADNTLFVAAIAIRVYASLKHSRACQLDKVFATPTVAFCGGHQ